MKFRRPWKEAASLVSRETIKFVTFKTEVLLKRKNHRFFMTLFSSHIQRPHVQKIISGIEILRV